MHPLTRIARRTLAVSLIAGASSCPYPPIPAEFEGGSNTDASPDADVNEVIPEFNGCASERFVDRSDSAAMRIVSFGGRNGSDEFGYAPACITIAAGETVRFSGDFSTHPLSPGTGPHGLNDGTPGNPIPRTPSGSMLDVPFPTAGTYPYFCEMHVASGMAGVVHVR